MLNRVAPWAAAAALLAVACTRPAADAPLRVALVPAENQSAYIEVTGLSPAQQRALGGATLSDDDWQRILFVAVGGSGQNAVGIAGRYAIVSGTLRFTPLFPFDPGRRYDVRFDPAAIPGGGSGSPVTESVALPAPPDPAPTFVTAVFPSGDALPENQLRLYIHFSAPMGRRGALEHVKLLDDRGGEVPDPFLPLEAEFWTADRTRYTVFFDPGRQKRGILPNRQMGPSLVEGRSYTLVVAEDWTDGHGRPLRETFMRRFRVAPPALAPIAPSMWNIEPPARGTRQPIVVMFREPLDHGLLLRAIGVRRDGQPVVGDIKIDDNERRWTMTPSDAWLPGRYELIALSILEDRAGNRIGRAFEVQSFRRASDAPEPAVTALPFALR